MNTILITGTAKTIPVKLSNIGTGFKVEYSVNVWASKKGEPIEFITSHNNKLLCGYGELWEYCKSTVSGYYDEPLFNDGAYTQFLDHLIIT